MPETWGITDTGFLRETFTEVQARVKQAYLDNVDPDLDVEDDTFFGQDAGIVAREVAAIQEVLEITYHAMDPDAAEDAQLDNVGKLTGTTRNDPTYSRAELSCVFTAGDTLTTDTHFVAVEDREDVRFTPETTASYAVGTHLVIFRAEFTGPITALAGKINQLSAVPVGLLSASNPADAIPGSDVETDPDFRDRREEDLSLPGSSTEDAIAADVRALADTVNGALPILSCRVYSNRTSEEFDGLPPNSFETIISAGPLTAEHITKIAQTIFGTGLDGIQPYGTSTATAVDETGEDVLIGYTLAEDVDIYVTIELDTDDDFQGQETLLTEWIDALENKFGNGDEVVAEFVKSFPLHKIKGVIDVLAFAIGTTVSPTLDDNIPITKRQKPAFDSSRFVITYA